MFESDDQERSLFKATTDVTCASSGMILFCKKAASPGFEIITFPLIGLHISRPLISPKSSRKHNCTVILSFLSCSILCGSGRKYPRKWHYIPYISKILFISGIRLFRVWYCSRPSTRLKIPDFTLCSYINMPIVCHGQRPDNSAAGCSVFFQ